MKSFSDYSALVDKAIKDINYPDGELASLYEPIQYAMSAGGKRLRPGLMLMSCEAFGGDASAAMDAACGIEMFHNFTLLHDDVMDNSDTRRGRPSVHTKWNTNSAILSGDTMLTLATRLISKVPDNRLRLILDIFNNMAIRVYEGQAMDMDFEKRDDITKEDYIRMIMDKTGALIGAAAQIGALIGGASEKEAQEMYEYGMMLGIAFQIQDDWLDVYGDASTFGKPIGGDINNNKKTYLLLSAMECDPAQRKALVDAMALAPGETKVRIVTNIYDRLKISEISRKAVGHYSALATAALKRAGIPEENKELFRKLTDKLTGRKI